MTPRARHEARPGSLRLPARRRRADEGITIVEMLVVLGIIGLVATLSIPVVLTFGLNPTRQIGQASRDLYTQLKTAKIYAGTYNVETALAYGGRTVTDSVTGELVPIIDSFMTVRRLKRDELEYFGLDPAAQDIFIPVQSADGRFRRLAAEGCILSDVFKIVNGQNDAGLSAGRIYNPENYGDPNELFLKPVGFDANGNNVIEPSEQLGYQGIAVQFPMHAFQPSGEMTSAINSVKQRVQLNLGVMPDSEPADRFPDTPEAAQWLPTLVQFNQQRTVTLLRDPTDASRPAELHVPMSLYLAQGRVKVES